jgi:hypothetical protein
MDLLRLVERYQQVIMNASPDTYNIMRAPLTGTTAAIDVLESKLGLSEKTP